jgi:uncharacterized protein (TIGR03435 family)
MPHFKTALAIAGASLMLSPSVPAQVDAAEMLRFDSATVTLAEPGAVQNRPIPSADPTRLSITSMNLTWLVYTAYEEGLGTAWKVRGGPDWVDATRFAIEARAPQASTSHELRMMLRGLLAERFGLQVREETAMPEVYILVLDRSDGKLGPNIREWDGTCGGKAPVADDDPYMPRCPSGYAPQGLMIEGGTMFAAGDALSLPPTWGRLGGNLVQDRTGLTGRYTMRLDFPFGPWNQARSQNPDETSKDLIEAVREQWGLRIEKGIGVLHAVEIEHAEMPFLTAASP